MKRYFLFCLLSAIIGSSSTLCAQTDAESLQQTFDRSDWFALDQQRADAVDLATAELTQLFAATMLHDRFNRPQAALMVIDTLLVRHQKRVGLSNIARLIALKSRQFARLGRYADAAGNASYFLHQLDQHGFSRDTFPQLNELAQHYGAFTYLPPATLTHPSRADVVVRYELETVADGRLIVVPVTIRGKTYRFILDTGSAVSFISTPLATELSLFVADESADTYDPVAGRLMYGVVDSMQIGQAVVRDWLVCVGEPRPTSDAARRVDAVLGLDFLRLAGEVQIHPKSQTLLIPSRRTPLPRTGRNLLIDADRLYLKSYAGRQRMIFQLDAGHTAVELLQPDGSSSPVKGNKLKLKVGKKRVSLRNVARHVRPATAVQPLSDGILGTDFLLRCRRATISLDRMFVDIR